MTVTIAIEAAITIEILIPSYCHNNWQIDAMLSLLDSKIASDRIFYDVHDCRATVGLH